MAKTGEAGPLGRHPGRSRGKGRPVQKGRQVDPAVRGEVRMLLGEGPYRRDLLVEYLHILQDRYGCLAAPHLAALAELMRLPMTEVYEVATFYHAFDVVKESATAPAAVTIRVCNSLVCEMLGAADLARSLGETYGATVRVTHGACMGRCDKAPVVSVQRRYIANADVASVAAAIDSDRTDDDISLAVTFDDYRAEGGYRLLEDCLTGGHDPDGVIAALNASGLRGLGGAGFPAGRKWGIVRAEPGPRLMAVNADESEPGTFKDRHYLERNPHRFFEGVLLGAWAIQAEVIYIYLRTEYPHLHELLSRELTVLRDAGLCSVPVEIRRGAGAYICGEESAMLESIEGRRGLPRHKPPYPSQVGLFGRPTLINNVETLFHVREAVEKGATYGDGVERNGRKGLRSFSVSGRVKQPGVKLAPAGITARELIDEFCGGMRDGHDFTAYLPGGASGGIFPAAMGNIPLDFGCFEPHGGLIGSAGVIVLSQHDPIADAVRNLLCFFAGESCGQCTPCRVGTEKAVQMLSAPQWDRASLADLTRVMADASICGLGHAAGNSLVSTMRFFPETLP